MTDRPHAGHPEPMGFARSADGVEAEFAALYLRFHDGIRRTLGCLGVPTGALDDALQEVFVVVHRRMDEPARIEGVRGWMYGIARRVAWRHHRTAGRIARKHAAVEPPADDARSPERELERREAIAFMHEFLDSLDPDQREVFVLAEIEGLSAPEIAGVVEGKLNTVYSRLRLARARFEQALARQHARTRREVRHAT